LSNLEATGQTILHCSWGVPTLPTQRALIRIIHTLWDTGDPPNERTLAWTYWWTEWLASLLDKGLWTIALVAECQGIDKLALLLNKYRSNPRVIRVVLNILIWLSTDKAGKEEIMRVEGWKMRSF